MFSVHKPNDTRIFLIAKSINIYLLPRFNTAIVISIAQNEFIPVVTYEEKKKLIPD